MDKAARPHGNDDVEVHVTFAAAGKPYNHKYEATTTIATMLQDALTFFGIQTDGTTRYFFLADGDEQDPTTTVGAIAEAGPGHSKSIKLSLRTETISGNN
jgi:hypothetical protein